MLVGTDVGRVGNEVVAVDVIYVSVFVIVHTGFAIQLSLVDPEVVLQVGVVYLETAVDNGDNHILRTCYARSPCLEDIGVGTSLGTVDATVVLVMPLVLEQGVVEGHGRGSLGGLCHRCRRHLDKLLSADGLVHRHALRLLHALYGGIQVGHLCRFHVGCLVTDIIPKVEPISLVLRLILAGIREDTLHGDRLYFLVYPV